jgi:hypothetical protein
MSASKTTGICMGQDINLTLYLKHFRDSTIDYILKTTGYKSITEYEVLCRSTDSFPITITSNGVMMSQCPNVDTSIFGVFPLSIHHLYRSVVNRIMDHYIGMEQLDYEFMYGSFNTIYVVVPYKEKWSEWLNQQIQYDEETEEDVSDEEWEYEEEVPKKVVETKKSVSKKQSKRVVESSDSEDDVPLVRHESGQLSGWKFTLNTETKNSYILTPPHPIKSVHNGKVTWGAERTPTTWDAPLDGLSRPVYYSRKYLGWIVSLGLRDELLSAGAKQYK